MTLGPSVDRAASRRPDSHHPPAAHGSPWGRPRPLSHRHRAWQVPCIQGSQCRRRDTELLLWLLHAPALGGDAPMGAVMAKEEGRALRGPHLVTISINKKTAHRWFMNTP